jgi:hypothetical protein
VLAAAVLPPLVSYVDCAGQCGLVAVVLAEARWQPAWVGRRPAAGGARRTSRRRGRPLRGRRGRVGLGLMGQLGPVWTS